MVQLGTFTSSQLNHTELWKRCHILSKLQSREAQSVPFFAALPVLHGSGMTMLIVLFSIQSRKSAEYIKSDQLQWGRTSKEHFSTSEDAAKEQLLSNASLRSGTIQHPPLARSEVSSTEEKHWQQRQRRSVRWFSIKSSTQVLASLQPEWICLDNNISLSQYPAWSRAAIIDWFCSPEGKAGNVFTPTPPTPRPSFPCWTALSGIIGFTGKEGSSPRGLDGREGTLDFS